MYVRVLIFLDFDIFWQWYFDRATNFFALFLRILERNGADSCAPFLIANLLFIPEDEK